MVSFRVRQLAILAVLVATALLLLNALYVSTGSTSPSVTEIEHLDSIQGQEGLTDVEVIVFGEDGKNGSPGSSAKSNIKIEGQGCRIPKLDINGSDVIGFFSETNPLVCRQPENWVFIDNDGHLQLSDAGSGAECQLSYFDRKDDNYNRIVLEEALATGKPMKHDFATVTCKKGFSKWSGLLMSVVKKELHRKPPVQVAEQPLNVYFIGFDSVSHMTFLRKMPKTHSFLENIGAVTLNGYNIVGDGTPQAFIPILTAETEEELPLTRKRFNNANYVDDVYPFIWKNFSDAGYVTAYGEDAFAIGTFTYRLKGFRNQPTDHYTRTFFKAYESAKGAKHCLGSEPLHKNWFRYTREFMRVYNDTPRFLLFHQSLLSHDDVNLVNVEDDDVAEHLKEMEEKGYLDNTVLIVMADHGHRFAKLRDTHQGQLEERLPYFSIRLPKIFTETPIGKAALQNLLENKNRLTTPFDIHATLMDVLKIPSLEDVQRMQIADKVHRSLSLLRPIPDSRTCADAGIAPHWCTCLAWEDAMKTQEDRITSLKLAHTVVATMNKQLQDVLNLCHPLRLKSLISAKKLMPNRDLLKYKTANDKDGFVPDLTGNAVASFAHYQLKLSTKPGRGVYEVTLFYDFKEKRVEIDLSSISHVSKYGDDPHCIVDKNYFLATYCVCYDKV